MKIKLTSMYVDNQEKALRFYTEVLGFTKKADFSNGPFRWLTVASPEEPDGTELQLALNDNPAAKAYQQAIFQQRQPAVMFFTDDVKGDYERIKARGAQFAMPPTAVTGSTIAQLNDTCGNSFRSPSWHAGRAQSLYCAVPRSRLCLNANVCGGARPIGAIKRLRPTRASALRAAWLQACQVKGVDWVVYDVASTPPGSSGSRGIVIVCRTMG